jgi:hypothetical protein
MPKFLNRFTAASLFAALFTVLIVSTVGWDSDHTALIILVAGLLLIHRYTYRAVFVLLSFLLFYIIYDTLPALPNYTVNDVHILEPYNIELALFGMENGGKTVVPSEWFKTRTHDVLSIIAGLSYILWMPLPMAYACYLFFKDKKMLFTFGAAFLLTCIIGMIGYYIYPAAPPWYYINYGVGTDFTIPGSEGLLSEFDRIIGSPVFNSIYAKGGNVFCAIPSLHCAYPVLCILAAWQMKNKWHMLLFTLWALGTWFAAVYSQHHYIIDAILGILCALLAYGLVNALIKTARFKRIRQLYIAQIS